MEPSQLSASSAPASAPDASESALVASASQNSPAAQDYYIDPTLYDGRPSDCSGRLNKEILTYDLLDQLQIPYKRLDHDAMPTIEACHQVDKLLGIEICKNLFLTNAQKTKFYLLLMPGTKKFKTKDLSRQIGSARLSFAGPEYMERFLDITPGSVSILGLMNDKGNQVQLIIDKDVIEGHPYIGCHPCINTSSLRIKTSDILEHFLPAVHHSYLLVDLPSEE
ncbi:MAG: prolyl-tRNA synthetase associated domain-containing protein [Lachnospiraceae bacterium]|nr:prolyl-tRNA synthetase associated domain-containing protein [Lachnospiraceae bacterium]